MTKPLTGTLIDLFNPDLYADIPESATRGPIKIGSSPYFVTEESRKRRSEAAKEYMRRKRAEGKL